MSNLDVLIIGGGLGGLSLAQGLKQAGIPFHIFERDAASDFRAQGYRIRVGFYGPPALRKLLPPELFQTFEDSCARVVPGGARLDAVTGERQSALPAGGPLGLNEKAYNADRTVMRNVLLSGLEDHISFGKKLTRYEFHEDRVTAYFEDGAKRQGRMIVGADGTRSIVRRQMLPDHVLLDTEGRAIFGKTPVIDDLFDYVSQEFDGGICVASNHEGSPSALLFTDIMRFDRSTKVKSPQDYIYWVLIFRKDQVNIPDQKLLSLSGQETVQLSLEMTNGWKDSLRNILIRQTPEASSTLGFYITGPNVQSWETDARITLLGDASHPMPPIGGVGANQAFKDAADLLDCLKDDISIEKLAAYEEGMRQAARDGIARAVQGASRFFSMKPLEELKPVTS